MNLKFEKRIFYVLFEQYNTVWREIENNHRPFFYHATNFRIQFQDTRFTFSYRLNRQKMCFLVGKPKIRTKQSNENKEYMFSDRYVTNLSLGVPELRGPYQVEMKC